MPQGTMLSNLDLEDEFVDDDLWDSLEQVRRKQERFNHGGSTSYSQDATHPRHGRRILDGGSLAGLDTPDNLLHNNKSPVTSLVETTGKENVCVLRKFAEEKHVLEQNKIKPAFVYK
ncbi:hypothetical protein BJ742DRAFT_741387 [Cladochytrium replicatum]|nr:hypothetical protein BJ742DRAFT_741387 [Cladochytrium replicatum]